ncbi:hypothetical protein SK128_016690 [Halocaridina rubra]|uniref:Uncharacterized protein n=1 Tax=Halocaridina rubra TaxID=373956 RepID=A0AAN8ZU17_HALRR
MGNDEGASDRSDGTAGVPQPILPALPQPVSLQNCQLPYCPYHRATSVRCSPVVTADAHQSCVTIARHSFLFLARSLASLTSILLSFRALLTPSIHPNLGLPLAFLPSTLAFITFFSNLSSSILSTWPNHLRTFISTLAAISLFTPVLALTTSFLTLSNRRPRI